MTDHPSAESMKLRPGSGTRERMAHLRELGKKWIARSEENPISATADALSAGSALIEVLDQLDIEYAARGQDIASLHREKEAAIDRAKAEENEACERAAVEASKEARTRADNCTDVNSASVELAQALGALDVRDRIRARRARKDGENG